MNKLSLMEKNNLPEDLFKDALSDLEINPSKKSWADISNQLDADVHGKIQQKFENFEPNPKPEVWEGIKTQLPYNLRIRRQLNWLSKIAAVLLIGMLFTVGSNMLKLNNQREAAKAVSPTPTPTTIVETIAPLTTNEDESDFVFDVNKKKEVASKLMEEEEDINSLLDFILDDSDDIAIAIDEDVIEESLTPADELTDGIALVTPEDDVEPIAEETIDLTIKIPLVVVEENEIESLIDMYDANASHGVNSTSIEK